MPDEIQTVANNLILDMYSEVEPKYAVPSDEMIEETVDGFCKREKWHTPKRAVLYEKIMKDLGERRKKDIGIDIDACAADIFNGIEDLDDVQYDAVENAVIDYLISEQYTQRHFDVLHKRVVACIEHILKQTIDPLDNAVLKEVNNDG